MGDFINVTQLFRHYGIDVPVDTQLTIDKKLQLWEAINRFRRADSQSGACRFVDLLSELQNVLSDDVLRPAIVSKFHQLMHDFIGSYTSSDIEKIRTYVDQNPLNESIEILATIDKPADRVSTEDLKVVLTTLGLKWTRQFSIPSLSATSRKIYTDDRRLKTLAWCHAADGNLLSEKNLRVLQRYFEDELRRGGMNVSIPIEVTRLDVAEKCKDCSNRFYGRNVPHDSTLIIDQPSDVDAFWPCDCNPKIECKTHQCCWRKFVLPKMPPGIKYTHEFRHKMKDYFNMQAVIRWICWSLLRIVQLPNESLYLTASSDLAYCLWQAETLLQIFLVETDNLICRPDRRCLCEDRDIDILQLLRTDIESILLSRLTRMIGSQLELDDRIITMDDVNMCLEVDRRAVILAICKSFTKAGTIDELIFAQQFAAVKRRMVVENTDE
jgi:hypothetical protein